MSNKTVTLTIAVMAAIAVVATPMVAGAFNPQPEPPAVSGLAGLTLEQTARISVVVLPDPADTTPAAPESACEATLSITDISGTTVARSLERVGLGTGVFLEFTPRHVERTHVYAVADLTCSDGVMGVASFELVDRRTGETDVFQRLVATTVPPEPV